MFIYLCWKTELMHIYPQIVITAMQIIIIIITTLNMKYFYIMLESVLR